MNGAFNIVDKCRFCLENSGSVPIFGADATLIDMLYKCTSLKIICEQGGPQNACMSCVQTLYKAFSFREQCLRCEAQLQQFTNFIDIKQEIPTTKLNEIGDDWFDFDDNDLCRDGLLLKFNTKSYKEEKDVEIFKTDDSFLREKRKNNLDRSPKTYDNVKKLRVSKVKSNNETKQEILNDKSNVEQYYFSNVILEPANSFNQNIHGEKKSRQQKKKSEYICDICNRSVDKKWDLITHMRKHTGEKPFECDICNKKFGYLGSLNSHRRLHDKSKSFVCEECGASLSTKETLQAHMRLHTGEMPFSCGTCGRKFRAATNLRTHSKIHTQDKKHPCPVCSKMFYTKSDMRDHARRHTGEKPFTCPLCPRTFTGKNNQRLHMKIHAGQRDYHCLHCNKSFVSRDALVRHSRVHNSERAFGCGKCGKKFTHKSSLLTHAVAHTNSKDHVCDICNQRFGYPSGLHAHKKRKHNSQATRNIMSAPVS